MSCSARLAVIVPVNTPWNTRSRISVWGLRTRPMQLKTTAPARLARSTMGLRPQRSEARPHSGAVKAMGTPAEAANSPLQTRSDSGELTPSSRRYKGAKGRAKPKPIGVFAILSPATIRGYVFVEAMNTDSLRDIVKGVRRTRGIVKGETTFAEIEHFLTPKPIVSGIVEGDIVELIAGPFKGEKARVQQIDHNKEEITVELFEAMVPIPVTIRGDHVRVLEKER